MSETPAGWYDDGSGNNRYWDGTKWTNQAAPEAAPAPAAFDSTNTPAPQQSSGGAATKVLLGGLLGVVVAALAVGALLVTGVVNASASGSAGGGEGQGFASAEEAAIAYVEAFRDQDFLAMQQTFAVESYVEACDFESSLERTGGYMWSSALQSCPFPVDHPVGKQANIELRKAAVTQSVSLPFASIVSPEMTVDANSRRFADEAEMDDFLDQISRDFTDYAPGRISNIHTVAPVDIYHGYDHDRMEEFLHDTAATLGLEVSDYADVAVIFDLDGEQWVFAPSVGRYDDRWYLVAPQGQLSFLAGLDYLDGGFGKRDEL